MMRAMEKSIKKVLKILFLCGWKSGIKNIAELSRSKYEFLDSVAIHPTANKMSPSSAG